jgi:hypothetical protein
MISGSQNTQTQTLTGENYSLQEILKWTLRFLILWIEMLTEEIDFLMHSEKGKCRNNTNLVFFKFC